MQEVTMVDGSTVTADEQYLLESIIDPAAKIVKDYTNIMPANFKDQLSSEQIADIIAFIESLK